MSAVVNRRVFLETAQALAKASRPTAELIEAHRTSFQTLLGDLVAPAVSVEFVEIGQSAGAAQVPAEPVAEIVECSQMGQQTVAEIDGRWRFLPYGTKLYAGPAGAAQVPSLEALCKAIEDADHKSLSEGNYMLDSDDCIKVLRETWAALSQPPAACVAAGSAVAEPVKPFLVVNIGCIECGVSSDVVGAYETQAEADAVVSKCDAELGCRQGGQNAFEVFDLRKKQADEYREVLASPTTEAGEA